MVGVTHSVAVKHYSFHHLPSHRGVCKPRMHTLKPQAACMQKFLHKTLTGHIACHRCWLLMSIHHRRKCPPRSLTLATTLPHPAMPTSIIIITMLHLVTTQITPSPVEQQCMLAKPNTHHTYKRLAGQSPGSPSTVQDHLPASPTTLNCCCAFRGISSSLFPATP
jgi:hypothetical protein